MLSQLELIVVIHVIVKQGRDSTMGAPTPRTPLELIAYSIGKGRKQRKKLKERLASKHKEILTNIKNNPKADPTKVNAGASNPPTQSSTPVFTTGGKDFKGLNR